MTSFLERYQQGECGLVWADLQRLGAAIRHEPLWSEALAVARETMRRARFNIELLIPRLQAAGYVFGYAWLEELAQAEEANAERVMPHMRATLPPEELAAFETVTTRQVAEFRARARQPARPLIPPASDVQESLAELERLVGPIPLALHAWYEGVGQVDFVGTVPERWERLVASSALPQPSTPAQEPEGPSSLARREEEVTDEELSSIVIGPDELFSLDQLEAYQKPPFDPLYLESLEAVLHYAKGSVSMGLACREDFGLPVSPDHYGKYFTSGGGPYCMHVPNLTMDSLLEGEWHETTLVNYLRIGFAWAGLIGLPYFEQQGQEELRSLTAGLLPL